MKQLFITIAILTFSLNVFATKQEADLLINGNDTIYLKTFPLEKLSMKFRPFSYERDSAASSSACRRGYRAVWRIKDNKLYLEKIYNCHTDGKDRDENIFELFEKNGLKFQTKDNMIWADWYTQDFYEMKSSIAEYHRDPLYLYDGWNDKKKESDVILRIEKGYITKIELKS